MERLVTFRLEASKLNEREFNILMKQLIDSYTKEQIISCIFNHFYHQYLSHKQMDKLQNITESITNIIHLREENEQNDDYNESQQESKEETNETITLDLLPPDTIGQCASYLSFDDYKQFEQCNRIIYCSTNSPSTLYHLDMNHIIHSQGLYYHATHKKIIRSVAYNQSRFVLIKSLDLTKSGFHNHIKQFNRLERLCIDSKFAMDAMNLNIFKPIKVLQIIKKPDYNRFNRSSNVFHLHRLCNFLKQFPNLENLSIHADTRDGSQVTIYKDKNNQISNTLLPKLKILLLINPCSQDRNHYYISNHKHGSGFKHTFRDKMIKIYGKQMLSLTCGGHDVLDLSTVNKLKELMVINPNLNDLTNIITKLPHLQRFKIDGLPPSNNDIVVKNMIVSIIKCTSLEYIGFDVCYQQFVKLAQYLKNGFATTQMQRKQLKISFSTHYLIGMDTSTQIPQKISIRPEISINDSIEGLVNALQLSSINDFMLKFRYQIEDVHHDRYPEINNETKKQMINKLKQRYLVVEEVEVLDIKNRKFMKIIISNRNCKINGYVEQWLNKLAMF